MLLLKLSPQPVLLLLLLLLLLVLLLLLLLLLRQPWLRLSPLRWVRASCCR